MKGWNSRTQQAVQTPFIPNRNPQWNGNAGPSGITSVETQSAIEEVKAQAFANDRFLLLGIYGGNANVGRYLEFFVGSSSDQSPIYLVAAAQILAITCQTTAANATCDIGIFDLNVSSVTPVYTIVMNAQKRVQFSGTPLATLIAGALVALRVISGSINTPTIQLTLSAST